ncbi:MAG: 4-hydroxybenzoate octaprenyltransferase [Neisseriaceae bacterium]
MLREYLQLIRFDKPIGTLLLLWPTLWALFFAQSGIPHIKYIVIFALGVFLTRAAGCVFNDLFDSEFDKLVNRTKERPLASRRINKKNAFFVAIGLSLIAFILAIGTLTINTILLSIPAIILYITYPLFKRFFPIPQAYLGIAYSFGILMAFMQIDGHINGLALTVFFANLFWVIGYDTIYALVDIDDDVKIGIRTSAITFGKYVIHMVSLSYFLFISLMAGIGVYLNLKIWYFLGIGLALILLNYQILTLIKNQKEKYFKMFLLNNQVGLTLFFGILLNYLL